MHVDACNVAFYVLSGAKPLTTTGGNDLVPQMALLLTVVLFTRDGCINPWDHWAGSLGGITGNFEGWKPIGSVSGINGRDHWAG